MATTSYVSNLESILESLKNGIENGVQTAVLKIAAAARAKCPVGDEEKVPRKSFKVSVKVGKNKYKTVYKTSVFPTAWTGRKPGTLRDSIFTRVRWKDGVCLGWCKAGSEGTPDGSAFYAPFIEWGTSKMEAQPFMRPALRGVDLTDIAYAIGLEVGQTRRRGVKKKVYGTV